ncbi:PR-1-like protein [Coprinopsis sp. MPI-PUGE-AT-0042]|nr:PR-1-like protein [Coprinopsis sp. MPI-PUGE-AT-0042]
MARFTALVTLLAIVASASGSPADLSLTLERRSSQDWLNAHNTVRARHGARALTWGSDLEAAARNWAQRCVWQHSGGAVGSYGENLAAGTGSFPISSAVKSWADEVVDYNPNNPQASHFTQVVWKSTTRLGCATVTCNPFVFGNQPATYHVCEYDPPGNFIGRFPENVQV